MRIYTKTGDSGQTGLFGGERVAKDSPRVQAYGALDELNAVLGWARTQMEDDEIDTIMTRIQNELFVAGWDLATPIDETGTVKPSNVAAVERIHAHQTRRLEEEIDRFETELAPLTNFILSGGSPGGAALHMARGVCRRAERQIVSLAAEESINAEALRYVNRLSDHLFTLARLANQRAGVPEAFWSRESIENEKE